MLSKLLHMDLTEMFFKYSNIIMRTYFNQQYILITIKINFYLVIMNFQK